MNQLKIQKGCSTRSSLFVLFLLTCLGLSGCLLPSPQKKFTLYRPWFTETYVAQDGYTDSSKQLIIRLYDDGTYSMFERLSFSFGNWKWVTENKVIAFEPRKGLLETEPFYWVIKELASEKMEAICYYKNTFNPARHDGIYLLKGQPNKGGDDPFHYRMHKWRYKPDAPESLEAIKHRTLSYLRFLKSLYNYGFKNELDYMPIQWFAEPIQMHFVNGVRMSYTDELLPWELCFYNKEQSVKGYRFISGAVQRAELSESRNRFERNRDFLEELIGIIESKDMGIR